MESYQRNRNESKLFEKQKELSSLEEGFNYNKPCPDLAERIVMGYEELARMPHGWKIQDFSFAHHQANYYRRFLE